MTWRKGTALVIPASILAVILYDVAAYAFGGNAATISKLVLDASGGPLSGVALGAAFVVGTVFGHVFWPQSTRPRDGSE